MLEDSRSKNTRAQKGLYTCSNGYIVTEVIRITRKYGQWHKDGELEDLSKIKSDDYVVYIEVVKLTGDPDVLAGKVEKAHNADVHCVDWNPLDINLILTGSADHSVCMFDRRNLGSPVHKFEDHKAAVLCVQWCPDKSSIFGSSAEDGCLNIWDYEKWSPYNFVLGCSFLCFLLLKRIVGRRNKKLFWLPAIAPLVSVVLSTLIVYLTRADKHGVKIVKHIKRGLNPISIHRLQLNDLHATDLVKIGAIVDKWTSFKCFLFLI